MFLTPPKNMPPLNVNLGVLLKGAAMPLVEPKPDEKKEIDLDLKKEKTTKDQQKPTKQKS